MDIRFFIAEVGPSHARCLVMSPRDIIPTRPEGSGFPPVLLILSDSIRRAALQAVLDAFGYDVRAVSRIAELEEWPRDEVVITEPQYYGPIWLEAGATHVVILDDAKFAAVNDPRVTVVPHFLANWRIAAVVLGLHAETRSESDWAHDRFPVGADSSRP